ncbi:MAG: putative uroporphyrinogen decarboxylase [Streblomastix strix]|uniref:Putative uroporphyrinogen decarboxylase n=1 Tax=Streblomastix strix TaxID=222440 RepID=A0A5J4X1T8_9EUKA|nr:MAG: putative uroporphyrinogen decarboxylase [Streblomastix strix]
MIQQFQRKLKIHKNVRLALKLRFSNFMTTNSESTQQYDYFNLGHAFEISQMSSDLQIGQKYDKISRRQLILDVIENKPVDRIPVAFWFHFLHDETKINALKDPTLTEKLFIGQKNFIERFKPDLVKIMSDGFFFYPLQGDQSEILKIEDLQRLQPIEPNHPWIRKQVEYVRQVVSIQPDTMYFYNLFSPINTLRWLVGLEKIIEFITTDPELLSQALMRIGEGLAVLAKCAINEGKVDGMYYSVQNPDINRVSDETYRKIIKPSDLIALDAANKANGYNILHICGYDSVRNSISEFKDYESKIVNWASHVEDIKIPQGRDIFKNRCIIGGFANGQNCLIKIGSEQEIRSETVSILNQTGKRGIIVGADCSLPIDTPLQHLEWIRDEAAKAK